MQIRQLKLENFRLVRDAVFNLAPGANLIFGENAQGKTTILEAICYLSTGRSFRTAKDRECLPLVAPSGEMIPEFAASQADFVSHGTRHRLRGAITRSGKSFWVDDKPLPKLGDLWGLLNAVIFIPSDLELVRGGPAARRSLMGSLLARSSRFDLYTMQRYTAALRQRNALFRAGRRILPAEFAVQEEVMAEHAAHMLVARQDLIARLSPLAEEYVRQLTGDEDRLVLEHEPGFPRAARITPEKLAGDADSIDRLKEVLRNFWDQSREADRERGYTDHGPHRGDMALLLGGNDARSYSSQGQARTLVLALRLSELTVLRRLCGEPPILLLDDVLGELDQRRTRQFVRVMQDQDLQAVLTATDTSILSNELPINARFRIHAGSVYPVS